MARAAFAFADMSHRGSLLCLPDAIWAWPVTRPEQIDRHSLARVFDGANGIDTLIIGTGTEVWLPPRGLREALRAVQVGAGRDADGTCDPHLQHHAGRAAARRGRVDRGAMSMAGDVEDAAAFCADLVRSARFPRYASTLFAAGRASPRAAGDLRLQCRDSRVRDQVSQPLPGEMRLQWWTDMLAGAAMAASRAIRSRRN